MKFALTVLALTGLLLNSANAQTPSPQEMREIQTEVIRRLSTAIYLDDACKVLTTEAHTTLTKGFASMRDEVMQGQDAFSEQEVAALDKESRGNAKKLGCGEKADEEIFTAHDKVKQFAHLTGDDTQTALRFFKIYSQMKILNEVCHYYNDEMTQVFATKRDELGDILQKEMPQAYKDILLPEMKSLEGKKAAITPEACADSDIQQMVTMMAWQATDTFASTPVNAPDCTAGASCDLPSKLFKK